VLTAHRTADAVGEIVVVVVLVVLLEFEYFSDALNKLFELEVKEDKNDDVLLGGLRLFAPADTKLLDEVELLDGANKLVGVNIRLKLDEPLLVFEN
jgi:chemotaxis response regulator CheB